MKRTCLIPSDEEDVDGNLTRVDPPKKSRPQRSTRKKPAHLSESADLSQSDDDEDNKRKKNTNVMQSVRRRGRPCGSRNRAYASTTVTKSTLQNILPKPTIEENSNSTPVSIKVEPVSGSSNVNESTHSSAEKTESKTPIANQYVRKGKYDRQATPLCDAIMKEYSKRQRLLKMQGKNESPDLSDLPIKEMISKGKKNDSEEPKQSTSKNGGNGHALSEHKQALVSKLQVSGKGNDVIESKEQKVSGFDPASVKIKKEIDDKSIVCNKIEVKLKSNEILQPFGVIKPDVLAPVNSKIKSNGSEDDDNDPTWSPGMSTDKPRVTRSASRSQKTRSSPSNVVISNSPQLPPRTDSPQATSRLNSIVESISDLLNSEESSAIDAEAQNLLRKTQEFIKLKNEKLQINQVNSTTTLPSNIKIKQELTSQFENNSSDSASHSAQSLYSKEKCTFVVEFFSSYQEIFNAHVFNDVIPLMSEILLLWMDGLKECLQRMKNAHSVTIIQLRHKELQLAHQAYLKVVMSFGDTFFKQFDSIVAKINNLQTPKAIMTTWIYFITNSLFTKSPKYKGQMQKVRSVLALISKIYKYHHPLLLEVLDSSDEVYEKELRNLIQLIKYYYDQNYVTIPDVNLFANWFEHSENGQRVHSADLSLMDELVTEIKISSSMNQSRHKYSYEKDSSPSSSSDEPSCSTSQLKPSHNLSNVAAQFFESLQNESTYNSKRIEQKLNQVLSLLSDNKTQVLKSFQIPEKQSEQRVIDNNPGENKSQLSQILKQDHTGLDSLLIHNTKSASFKIKTEPIDTNEMEHLTSSNNPLKTNSMQSNNSQPDFANIKQEPEDFIEPPQFASVVIAESQNFYSELNDESVE